MPAKKIYRHPNAEVAGRAYHEHKPKDCRYCYFYGNKEEICTRESCYYLLPEQIKYHGEKTKDGDFVSDCYGCPYKTKRPCVGFCMSAVIHNMTSDEALRVNRKYKAEVH